LLHQDWLPAAAHGIYDVLTEEKKEVRLQNLVPQDMPNPSTVLLQMQQTNKLVNLLCRGSSRAIPLEGKY